MTHEEEKKLLEFIESKTERTEECHKKRVAAALRGPFDYSDKAMALYKETYQPNDFNHKDCPYGSRCDTSEAVHGHCTQCHYIWCRNLSPKARKKYVDRAPYRKGEGWDDAAQRYIVYSLDKIREAAGNEKDREIKKFQNWYNKTFNTNIG